ncbi:MAG: phage holin family protein [Burkholderiales bacterium]
MTRPLEDTLSSQSPASAGGTVSFSSFLQSIRALVDSFLHLMVLEGKQAASSLIFMVAFGLGAVVLVITGWLALVACVVVALVQNDIIGWATALIIAALLSFAGSGGLILLLIRKSQDLLFKATRRQLAGQDAEPEDTHGK